MSHAHDDSAYREIEHQELWPIFNNQVVTNSHGTDGFGSQFRAIIACVFYAELYHMKYAYTPFAIMEHNYDNDQDFLAKKEWLINFIGNFDINKETNAIIPQEPAFFFFHQNNVIQLEKSIALKKIKEIFRANKDKNNYFDSNRFNIAIHVRRPNPHDNRIDGTDTPDSVFLTIINKLRGDYFSKNPLFHVYSQGDRENFKAFEAPDIILHLNESIEDSFIPMVFADVLVTSRSTFSYTAGLLSEGTVYYMPPFGCLPLPHWITLDQTLYK